jgi:SAM-dependent methyltransferase
MTTAQTAAQRWRAALKAWVIPAEILDQAPASPWVHPPWLFVADAGDLVADSPSHRLARAALGTGGTVLDVGCGGGRSSLPLAPAASSVTGVDEQESMLVGFAAACQRASLTHREVLGRWPNVAADVAATDVVVCHHVVYNAAEIEPFVRALTEHARRLVVVELPEHHPMSPFAPLWRHFWGIDCPSEPSAELLVEVVQSLGHEVAVERVVRPPRKAARRDAGYVEFVRHRLCLGPERDDEIEARLELLAPRPHDAIVTLSWPGSADPLSSRS